jgi:Fur family ferric uptake transcriptional regulator
VHQQIDIEALCQQRGLRITEQRRVIAKVLSSVDHPDVDQLHARASAIDPGISIATVYRTVRLFEEAAFWIATISAMAAPAMKPRPRRTTTI